MRYNFVLYFLSICKTYPVAKCIKKCLIEGYWDQFRVQRTLVWIYSEILVIFLCLNTTQYN